jgi:hypothetical protein
MKAGFQPIKRLDSAAGQHQHATEDSKLALQLNTTHLHPKQGAIRHSANYPEKATFCSFTQPALNSHQRCITPPTNKHLD